MKNNATNDDPFKRIIFLGVGLGVGYWLSPVLFWILLGVYGAVLLTRQKGADAAEEEAEEEVTHDFDHLLKVRPDAVLQEHSVILTQGKWLIQVRCERSAVLDGVQVILAHCPIVTPIPFCFTIRPRKSLAQRDKLVSNTHMPSAFEYELRDVPLPAPLDSRFESATNAPRLFKDLLDSGFVDEMGAFLQHQQLLLQDICFDGSRVHISAIPAQSPEESGDGFEHLSTITEILADSLRSFIDINELVEAVRAKS